MRRAPAVIAQPKTMAPPRSRSSTPKVRTVLRRCRVCEWQDRLVETEGSDPDCPWCHAPTVATAIFEASSEDDEEGKNPHATALGRLGGVKGGHARAQTLSAKRRREIASKAART